MAIITAEDADTLRALFEEQLKNDVTIVHYTQRESKIFVPGTVPCAACRDTKQLLEEVVELSDRLHLETYDFVADAAVAEAAGVDKIPATVVRGRDGGERARFYGAPAGYEFTALLEDVLDAGDSGPELSEEVAGALEQIDQPVHLQVFVTPTCPYCPVSVRAAHMLALAHPQVTADMVIGPEFPHVANRYQVMAVPKTVINETHHFEGAVPVEDVAHYVLHAIGKHAGELLPEE
jgi:glutaredoxin-like protein